MSNNTVTPNAPPRSIKSKALAAAPPAESTEPEDKVESPVGRDHLGRLLRYGCAIPTIGGFFQAGYGLKEMAQGVNAKEKHDGKVDVAAGTASLGASVANLPYLATFYGLAKSAGPIFGAATLGPLGLVAGGFNALNAWFDGGRDVVNSVKEMKAGDPMAKRDLAAGLIKVGAGLAIAVGSVALSGPLIMGGDALYAVAALVQNRELVAKFLKKEYHELPGQIASLPGKVASLPGKVADKVLHRHPETPAEAGEPSQAEVSSPGESSPP
ncbi:MAG TPA: UbiA family prenyltransferase [Candidatus Xenobia bacterium]|jgi:hypothetical protein